MHSHDRNGDNRPITNSNALGNDDVDGGGTLKLEVLQLIRLGRPKNVQMLCRCLTHDGCLLFVPLTF